MLLMVVCRLVPTSHFDGSQGTYVNEISKVQYVLMTVAVAVAASWHTFANL